MSITGQVNINGIAVPAFFYGTAWKKDSTQGFVYEALKAGFRGIDTANQLKHYNEAGVGAALVKAYAAGIVKREDLFLQTKFTDLSGQDHRLPYDASADLHTQVMQSYSTSLEHLNTAYIDSYVLHGPYSGGALGAEDQEVWATMESLCRAGRTTALGISNVSFNQLVELCKFAGVKPSFVQNRCYASSKWDSQIRAYCCQHGISYQGFSLLTANRTELASPRILAIAKKYGRTVPQIVFQFCFQIGIIPLTGTSSAQHMREDLATHDFELSTDEIALIESVG